MAAYRIVQEALTNVMKHAGRPARAIVRVQYSDDHIRLEVTDDGIGASTQELALATGHGLVGHARTGRPVPRLAPVRAPTRWRFPGRRDDSVRSRVGRHRIVTLRVAVADDQELVRTGFAMILGSDPDIDVVGHAPNGREAVELCHQLRPDVS